MSVIVDQLTKSYGPQKAIDALSFEAKKGEILGFLGPNGAGKTTTMKILTCFMPPTSGNASVGGYDVIKDSFKVRERVGYLPEHNPLYKDLYVKEYLSFVAGLHRIKKPKARIEEMIEFTGLEREQHKKIGALSKGYRQRVGLAQAMFHDPDVLILDEPTSGLDPNQLKEIRQLIKNLGEKKTVIFSTHIMQEVQLLCDRVIIINEGKMVADDSIERLGDRVSGASVISIELTQKINPNVFGRLNGVQEVKSVGENKYDIVCDGEKDLRRDIFQMVVSEGYELLEMRREILSVEDVFQKLTSKTNA